MKPIAPGSAFLSGVVLLNLFGVNGLGQDSQPPAKLNIVIVEGEGALNNIKQRVNREPIVQVEDENHKPIAGAAVVFFLPNQGASGVFANGSQTLTLTTDANGRAAALGIHPNSVTGRMEIRVTASSQGQTATATITQMNVAGPSTGMSTTAKVLIVVGIAAGAAAGAIVATRGGSSSSSSSMNSPGIVITPGTPTVGGH